MCRQKLNHDPGATEAVTATTSQEGVFWDKTKNVGPRSHGTIRPVWFRLVWRVKRIGGETNGRT